MRLAGFIADPSRRQLVAWGTPWVSESWFYKWHDRPDPRHVRRAEIDAAMRASFDASGGDYGSRQVWEDLKEAGFRVSKETVEAAMAHQGLITRPPRGRRRGLTRPDKAAEPIVDLIKRDFGATEVDQRNGVAT